MQQRNFASNNFTLITILYVLAIYALNEYTIKLMLSYHEWFWYIGPIYCICVHLKAKSVIIVLFF